MVIQRGRRCHNLKCRDSRDGLWWICHPGKKGRHDLWLCSRILDHQGVSVAWGGRIWGEMRLLAMVRGVLMLKVVKLVL